MLHKKLIGCFTLLLFIAAIGCKSTKKPKYEPYKPAVKKYTPVEPVIKENRYEPPKAPILKIEIGMHSSVIRGIALDARNKYMVTASDDRTVRVWDYRKKKLLKILRPPISKGVDGMLYSVAISPDGKTVACGGWTGYDWDRSNSIYIFDRASGKMTSRLTGVPNVIDRLLFSPSGKHLVATFGGSGGIRVYQIPGYSLIKTEYYRGRTYGADFDRKGRLVTICYDGYIRLYDPNFNLITKKYTVSGYNPFSVAFNKDGSKIAVGYNDKTKVDVFSGTDLKFLYTPDTTGITRGNLSAVSWSGNGKMLFAGGMNWNPTLKKYMIRIWDGEGKGKYTDVPASQDTLMQMIEDNKKNVAYVTGDQIIGVCSPKGKVTIIRTGEMADYRDNIYNFRISADGSVVQFAYSQYGKEPAQIDLKNRKLTQNPTIDYTLEAPVDSKTGIYVSNWKNYTYPRINNRNIRMQSYERAHCTDISPDATSAVIGADWNIYHYSATGSYLWAIQIPAACWSINITPNGKTVVATLSDGTIRWYRLSDGKELLAFFPSKDKKRWIAWSPMGYFDSSEGADNMIGWHLNQGKSTEAKFYPILQFAEEYYRPDVVKEVITSGDPDYVVIARIGVKPANIRYLVTDKAKAEEEDITNKTQIGTVGKVLHGRNEILVKSGKAGELMQMGDKVFVIVNGKKVVLSVEFPMQTVAKCKVLTKHKAWLPSIRKDMPVYK